VGLAANAASEILPNYRISAVWLVFAGHAENCRRFLEVDAHSHQNGGRHPAYDRARRLDLAALDYRQACRLRPSLTRAVAEETKQIHPEVKLFLRKKPPASTTPPLARHSRPSRRERAAPMTRSRSPARIGLRRLVVHTFRPEDRNIPTVAFCARRPARDVQRNRAGTRVRRTKEAKPPQFGCQRTEGGTLAPSRSADVHAPRSSSHHLGIG
jgi:hypothetical protein